MGSTRMSRVWDQLLISETGSQSYNADFSSEVETRNVDKKHVILVVCM